MKWLFRLAFRGQYQQIVHMRAEIAWLREQMTYERERANNAVDQLLQQRAYTPPITPQKPPAGDDPIAELLKSADFAAMGSPIGVET